MTFGESKFESEGAERFNSVLSPVELGCVEALFGKAGKAGRRLTPADLLPVAALIRASGPLADVASLLIGRPARPVRAIAFDKSPGANWTLGWHQDRVIAVRERLEVEGFTAWTQKSGQTHVEPPIDIIDRMITLRVHIDAVNENNAPLQVILGSHKLGRLSDQDIAELTPRQKVRTCLAEPGDIWAYSTAIVHRSAEQRQEGRRRVLQLDYSADELPGGLNWQRLY